MSNTVCTTCGREYPASSRFCSGCGASNPLVAAAAAPAPEPVAAAPAAPVSAPVTAPHAPAAAPSQPAHQPWQTAAATQPVATHAAAPHAFAPRAGGGVSASLFGSLTLSLVLIGASAALAFNLPGFVYAFGTYGSDGSKATLAFFLALTIAAAVLGTVGAAAKAKVAGNDQVVARLGFMVGVFASVLATLQFFTALGT